MEYVKHPWQELDVPFSRRIFFEDDHLVSILLWCSHHIFFGDHYVELEIFPSIKQL
jgi:hypothetical protein